MTDQANVESTLLAYLVTYHPECGPLAVETDLIESGQLDSLVLVDLLLVLQTQFQLELQPQDIAPKNFRSLRTIAELTIARLASTRRAA
jgi:acyl carrier protein